MALRPILEVCDRETGYERGGRRREPWSWKMADRKKLSAGLIENLAAARARRWESGRRDKGRIGREVAESDEGSERPWYVETETCNDWVCI